MNDRAKEIYDTMIRRAAKNTFVLRIRSSQVQGALVAAAVEIEDMETRLAALTARVDQIEGLRRVRCEEDDHAWNTYELQYGSTWQKRVCWFCGVVSRRRNYETFIGPWQTLEKTK